MSPRRDPAAARGFTVIELLIVVGIVAIVVTLAAPSLRGMIEMQRLKSASAQVVTDIQFARSEAAARQTRTFVTLEIDGSRLSCYAIHTCGTGGACRCFCSREPLECDDPSAAGIRTVSIPWADGVTVAHTRIPGLSRMPTLSFDPVTGGMTPYTVGALELMPQENNDYWIDTALIRGGTSGPRLRTAINPAGRPTVCSVNGGISGVPAC